MNVAQPLVQSSLLGEAIDGAALAVFVADEDLKYVAVNRRACELLGYTREELLSLLVSDVARHPEAVGEFDDMVASGAASGTALLAHKDGTTVAAAYRASTTTVAGITFYVSVCWPA
jgi:PAS domain S-box-containing protein